MISAFKFNLLSILFDNIILLFIICFTTNQISGIFSGMIFRALFVNLPLISITYSLKSFTKLKLLDTLLISYTLTYVAIVLIVVISYTEPVSWFEASRQFVLDKITFLVLLLPHLLSFALTLIVYWFFYPRLFKRSWFFKSGVS